MGLPVLVFRTEIEGAGMLEVWWQDDRLIPGFAGKLNSQVPGIESDKGELIVLRQEVLVGEVVDAGGGVSESSGVPHMLPGECR